MSRVACCLLHVVCCLLSVDCCVLHVACRVPAAVVQALRANRSLTAVYVGGNQAEFAQEALAGIRGIYRRPSQPVIRALIPNVRVLILSMRAANNGCSCPYSEYSCPYPEYACG